MKVLHLTSAFRPYAVGGAEVVVHDLSVAQSRAGLQPYVMHLSPEDAAPYTEAGVVIHPLRAKNLMTSQEHVRSSPILRLTNKVYQEFNPFLLTEVERFIDSQSPDVVHTHSLVDLPSRIWKVAAQRGAKVVHTLHDYDLICSRGTLYNGGNCPTRETKCRVYSAVKAHNLRYVDRVVAISQLVLSKHAEYGILGERHRRTSKVIWNGTAQARSGARSRPPTRRDENLRFGYIGRIVPEKGLWHLLEACRKLPSGGWTLSVAGRMPDDQASLLKAAHGLPVNFNGWVDAVRFLDEVDVLVVPSLWDEPFGLTVIEGVAKCKAVIGSSRGAIPEILNLLSSSLVFDADDADSLSKIMSACLQDPSKFYLSEEKRDRFLSIFSTDRMEYEYRKLYEDICELGVG